MAMIDINNLTFAYDGSSTNVFEGLTLRFDTDWKLGLVGRNGKGKTTFLRLLMGEYEYSGTISAGESFRYFPAVIPVNKWDEMAITLLQDAFPDREDWMILREVNLMGMNAELLYRPWTTLSFGERTKIMLCCLFSGENEFLLIDEPTNHLDEKSREAVKNYLQGKNGFILVSHDRDILDAVTDHTLAFNRTSVEVVRGNFTTWWENKQQRDQSEAAQNENLRRDIKRLEDAARKASAKANHIESQKIGTDPIKDHDRSISTRAYLGAKSKKLQQGKKNMEKRQAREIDLKKDLLKDTEKTESLKIHPVPYRTNTIIRLKDLSLRYEDSKNVLGENISAEINNGDRVLIKGSNGSGKSSLIKVILRMLGSNHEDIIGSEKILTSGQLYVAPGVTVSYLSQDTSHMHGTPAEYALTRGIDRTLFFTILRKLDFEPDAFDADISTYSEGQKKKTAIAASLSMSSNIYIWDEPLNYVDIFSRMQFESLLMEYKPTMLVVEHDKYFADKVATKVIEL